MSGRGWVAWTLVAALGLCALSCQKDPALLPTATELFDLELPGHWPAPPLRADNPLTKASVELGKLLFADKRLSLGRGISCASCHLPARAFSDSVARSHGVDGRTGFRNAPSLANVAYAPLLLWDGGAPTLEQHAVVPFFAADELDADPQQVVELLAQDPAVQAKSMAAYGRPMDLYVLTRSLANYQRTLIGGSSRYDRYLLGDEQALDASEKRGVQVFFGPGGCATCHAGHLLTDGGFHNTGLSDGEDDTGRERITLHPADRGKFKTPGLRNIALTAPYMHDGSLATLEEVIAYFDAGGGTHPNKDPAMAPLALSQQQQQDLAAFLRALTDEAPLDIVP